MYAECVYDISCHYQTSHTAAAAGAATAAGGTESMHYNMVMIIGNFFIFITRGVGGCSTVLLTEVGSLVCCRRYTDTNAAATAVLLFLSRFSDPENIPFSPHMSNGHVSN